MPHVEGTAADRSALTYGENGSPRWLNRLMFKEKLET